MSSTQQTRPLENVVLRWNFGQGLLPSKTSVSTSGFGDEGSRWEVENDTVRPELCFES